jgi:hypothetical protein
MPKRLPLRNQPSKPRLPLRLQERTNKHHKQTRITSTSYGRLANPNNFLLRPKPPHCANATGNTNTDADANPSDDDGHDHAPDDNPSQDDRLHTAADDAGEFLSEDENPSDDDGHDATAEVNKHEDDPHLGSSDNDASQLFQENLTIICDELLSHLQTKLGGEKKLKEAKQFVRTFEKFIKFSFHENEDLKNKSFHCGIRQILRNSYPLVGKYLEQRVKHLKSGTILNYWNHLLISLRWFHFDCDLNKKKCRGLYAFEDYMKRLRKAYRRAMRKEMLSKNTSYENLVKQGRLPSGGLQELFGYVKKKTQWVLSLESKDFENRKVYNSFTDWLYSVFWVSMIQGRNSGLEDLKYSQRFELLDPLGHETTTKFKTALVYNIQALSSSELFSIGLRVYLDKARKHVAVGDAMHHDDSPLFLTFQGDREYRAGAKVIRKSK